VKHLLSVTDLDAAAATGLLDTADRLKQALLGREVRKLPTLRGRTVITMFYENSTRTRVSFEVAGKWMSADTVSRSEFAMEVVERRVRVVGGRLAGHQRVARLPPDPAPGAHATPADIDRLASGRLFDMGIPHGKELVTIPRESDSQRRGSRDVVASDVNEVGERRGVREIDEWVDRRQ
jgi:hypothetical protein